MVDIKILKNKYDPNGFGIKGKHRDTNTRKKDDTRKKDNTRKKIILMILKMILKILILMIKEKIQILTNMI